MLSELCVCVDIASSSKSEECSSRQVTAFDFYNISISLCTLKTTNCMTARMQNCVLVESVSLYFDSPHAPIPLV